MTTGVAHAISQEQVEALRTAMRETFFRDVSAAFLESPEGVGAVEAQVMGRFNEVTASVVPWIGRHIELADSDVVEIGCGAAASTAAVAAHCRGITGYDIDAAGIDGARRRMDIMGITNCEVHLSPPEELLGLMESQHPEGVDAVLCYAVLEHQTFTERIETLKTAWRMLREGGVLVVADTPNRLTYTDHHTSFLPFFHMLPHEVAVAYSVKSARTPLWQSIQSDSVISEAAATERLIRWGRGVSYHEFELAIGDLTDLVVGDGFDPEVLGSKPVVLDERLLFTYAQRTGLKVPVGFFRQSLDVILKKSATPQPPRVRYLPILPMV